MERSRSGIVLAAAIAFAGCGGDAETPATSQWTAGAERSDAIEELCPADLPGLAAQARDTREGGAIVLTTNREHVYELRHRMRRFAEEHRNAAGARARETLSRGERGEDEAAIDSAMVRVVEIPRGARLEVRPRDVTQVRALREELRADARELAAGRCPLALTLYR